MNCPLPPIGFFTFDRIFKKWIKKRIESKKGMLNSTLNRQLEHFSNKIGPVGNSVMLEPGITFHRIVHKNIFPGLALAGQHNQTAFLSFPAHNRIFELIFGETAFKHIRFIHTRA